MDHRSTPTKRRRRESARDKAIRLWLADRRRHEQLDAELRSILRDTLDTRAA